MPHREALAPRWRERVIARAPVTLRSPPLGFDPSIEQQSLQRGVERALADLEHIVRHGLEVLGDAVPVHPSTGERLEKSRCTRPSWRAPTPAGRKPPQLRWRHEDPRAPR